MMSGRVDERFVGCECRGAVRLVTISHGYRNWFSDGCPPEDELADSACGLTDVGEALVERMNQRGMVVDVSHLGDTGSGT